MDSIEGFEEPHDFGDAKDFVENGLIEELNGPDRVCETQDALCEAQDALCEAQDALCAAQDLMCEGQDEVCEVLEENIRTPVQKKYCRDFENPFEHLSEDQFKLQYRMSKNAVMHCVLPTIHDFLAKPNKRGLPINPIFQLLVTLRFYATANFQTVCNDHTFVSQPTVSRVVFRVSTLIASLLRTTIKMPTTGEAIEENRRLFAEAGMSDDTVGLPSIDGAVDCTHVKLTPTRFQQYPEAFRNRKGYFSLNVQAVIGPRMEFMDIIPETAGSEHDSMIFQHSRIYMKYRERYLTGYLLGDEAYPCLPCLLSPVSAPQTSAQERYNYVHSHTHMVAGRAIDAWKRRFPCLCKGLTSKLICTTAIIVACAVLHNLSLEYDSVVPDDDPCVDAEDDDDIPVGPPMWHQDDGAAIRDALIDGIFEVEKKEPLFHQM